MRSILLSLYILLAPLMGLAQSVQNIKIIDPTDEVAVDTIILPSGKRALQTSGLVQIDQLFGQDPQASTFFYIGDVYDADGVGAENDTVRIEIVAAESPLNIIYPAVDVTTTVSAAIIADVNPERALSIEICNDLSADADFIAAQWRCIVMSDYSGVFIHSSLFNEFGARQGCILPAKCFSVTPTGTTVITEVYTDLIPRGLTTELSRSPNNPRQGVLAISGSVSINAESINNSINTSLMNGASDDMAVNGSVTPVIFEFLADATNIDNFFIQKVSCACQGNGIQFGKFCSINSPLSNGVEYTIISEGVTTLYANVKSTDDFKHVFTTGDPTLFGLDIQSGLDDLMATANFDPPIILEAGSGDLIKATVNDNVSALSFFKCRVFGFRRRK